MKKFKNNQQGIGAIEMMLIAVIVILLGFIGWFVYHSSHKTKDALDKTADLSGQQTSTKTTKTTTPAASTADKTFTFKEYGVKITLPDSLKDLSYSAKQIDNGDGTKATDLFLDYPSLATAIDGCNTTKGSEGNFAALNKGSGQFPADQPYAEVGSLLKQFDTFYISSSYPNGAPCTDSSKQDAVVAQMQALQKAMVEAFKTASLAQ